MLIEAISPIARLNSLTGFQDFARSGKWYDLATPLFRPSGGEAGLSGMFVVRACSTTAANLTLPFTGLSVSITTKEEGLGINGNTVDTNATITYVNGRPVSTTPSATPNWLLTNGYGVTLQKGVRDTSKYIVSFWRGTFAGVDENNNPYGLPLSLSNPALLFDTPEISTINELFDFLGSNAVFSQLFTLNTAAPATSIAITTTDLAAFATNGYVVTIGATTVYDSASLTKALSLLEELYFTFIIADCYGDGSWAVGIDFGNGATSEEDAELVFSASGSKNTTIQAWIDGNSKFQRIQYVGVSEDATDFAAGLATARAFNNESVVAVTSGCFVTVGSKMIPKSSLYHAAMQMGRIGGLAAQVPATFKSLGMTGLKHNPTNLEREDALKAGVSITYFDQDLQQFVITQGVTTFQDKSNDMFDSTGKTSFIAVKRIKAFVDASLVIQSKRELLTDPSGPNSFTISDASLIAWTERKLQGWTVSGSTDNILLEFDPAMITVTAQGDARFINYGFRPNTEVNKLLFTGFMYR